MSASSPPPADYGGQIQQNRDLQGQLLGQAQQSWAAPMQDGQQARDQASRAMYAQATSRLDPQWQRREEQTRAQLAAQGLDPTSEAARNEMNQLNMARTDAYNQADYSSQVFGGNAAQQTQGMDLAARAAPLAAYGGLLGGQLGMAGQQYQQAAANADRQNQFWGGIAAGGMGLLGSGLTAGLKP